MLIVVALGGNALLRRGEPADAKTQRENVELAAQALERAGARALAGDHPRQRPADRSARAAGRRLRRHGALSARRARRGVRGHGRLPARAGAARAHARATGRDAADAGDRRSGGPARSRIRASRSAPIYDYATAQHLAAERGWSVAADGEGWRRVVASPAPREILELQTIRTLVEAGVLVVCAGGGGIPVIAGRAARCTESRA